MKYYNKKKAVRESCWTVVEFPQGTFSGMNCLRWDMMKKWCQEYNNTKGRFYSGPYTSRFWFFENPGDALVFKLTWMTK